MGQQSAPRQAFFGLDCQKLCFWAKNLIFGDIIQKILKCKALNTKSPYMPHFNYLKSIFGHITRCRFWRNTLLSCTFHNTKGRQVKRLEAFLDGQLIGNLCVEKLYWPHGKNILFCNTRYPKYPEILKKYRVRIGYCQKLSGLVGYRVPVSHWWQGHLFSCRLDSIKAVDIKKDFKSQRVNLIR